MIRPQQFTAKLVEKIVLNEHFIHLYFELEQPNRIEFEAGQYISIVVSEKGERRSYSICSTPENNHGFELLVEIVPNGMGSTYLNNLPIGGDIRFLAPLGIFTVPQVSDNQAMATSLILIATGSGIAPFRSILMDQLQLKHTQRPITLYWGMRFVENLFWEDEFEEIAISFPNFHFHPTLSKAPDEWPLCRGRVTDCLMIHELAENADYYVCGSNNMIDDVFVLLQKSGVDKTKIHREKFN